MRGLAAKAGISPQTAKRLIDGTGSPAVTTVEAVADRVFSGDRGVVWHLIGEEREHEPYEPPPEVALLTARQRRALDELIRAMAEQQATSRRSAYVPGTGDPSQGTEPDLSAVLAAQLRSGELTTVDIAWAFDEPASTDGDANDAAEEVPIRRMLRKALRSVPEAESMAAAAREMKEEPRRRSVVRALEQSGEESQDPGDYMVEVDPEVIEAEPVREPDRPRPPAGGRPGRRR